MTSNHRARGTAILTPALLSAALLAGCSSSDDDAASNTAASATSSATSSGSQSSESSSSNSSSGSNSSGEYSDSVDAALASLRTAADAVPDGRPYDLERDDYDGQQAWDIKVASDGDKYKLYVSADGSQVLDQQQDADPGDDLGKVQRAEVEAADALRTAAGAHSGAELDELEIDTRRDGTLVWEIEFLGDGGSEIEVYVDAMTGDIIN